MVEPDFDIICETLLICGGFMQSYNSDSNNVSDIRTLARKIVATHSMANDILSCQVIKCWRALYTHIFVTLSS